VASAALRHHQREREARKAEKRKTRYAPLSTRNALTDQEQQRLLSHLTGKHLLAALLMLDAGLRSCEVRAITAADVHQDHITIPVSAAKGGRARRVPITPRLRRCIEAFGCQKAGSKLVVAGIIHQKQSVCKAVVWRWINLAAAEAGIHCSPHVLRHTFATRCLQLGVPLNELQLMLGHTQLATTAIYLHTRTDMLQRAAQLLDAPLLRVLELEG
jgi:integrase